MKGWISSHARVARTRCTAGSFAGGCIELFNGPETLSPCLWAESRPREVCLQGLKEGCRCPRGERDGTCVWGHPFLGDRRGITQRKDQNTGVGSANGPLFIQLWERHNILTLHKFLAAR